MKAIRLALIGIGKIARDQHLPALAASDRFALVAAVSRNAAVDGVANFADIAALTASGIAVDAVSICTPPNGRHAIAHAAIDAGYDVMLEKPPGATVGEVQALARHTERAGRTLYTSWHSRMAAGVAPTAAWLAGRTIVRARIAWEEDIRVWHPGQEWLLEPGGLGVFDPGINALSIATAILPQALVLASATLHVPAGRDAPIAADLRLVHDGDAPIDVRFDFLRSGAQRWDIAVETDRGTLSLTDGGRHLAIDGQAVSCPPHAEYAGLYAAFAALVEARKSEVDLGPLQLVADAFMLGKRETVDPFDF